MLPITNDDIMTAVLIHDMSEIINEVMGQVLQLLKDQIDKTVYEEYVPNIYQRQEPNGGFQDSWINNTTTMGNTIESTIESNPSLMTINREEFVHGSVYKEKKTKNIVFTDIREALAEIINEGKAGPIFGDGWWRSPRPFFDIFIQLLDSGKIEELIEQSFGARGIKWIKF